jgi:RNA polymerase primary sigma factor
MEHTVYKVKNQRPAARSRRPRSSREPLDLYFDQARRYPRLTAPQERAALVRLVELRRERWAALVSLPALRSAVLAAALEAAERSPGELADPTDAALGDPTCTTDPTSVRALDDCSSPSVELPEGAIDCAYASLVRDDCDRPSSEASPSSLDCPVEPSSISVAEAAFVARLESLDVDGTIAERLVDAALAVVRGAPQDELPPEALEGTDPERYYGVIRCAADRYLRARNRFVCSNLRLVAMVADRYSGRSMALADRVQEGNLGLIKAVERFDPEHGTRFSTYAVWWIRHAITRALVDRGRTVRIPAHLHAIFTKVRAARTELEGRLGRTARLSELAEAVELPVGKVRVALEAMSLRSVALDASDGDDEQPSWGDRLGTPAPQAEIDAHLDARRNETLACRALANLGVMERHILERRFELHGMPRMTLEALGQHYHLSRERIRQIQNRALAAIRHEVESSPLGGLAFA